MQNFATTYSSGKLQQFTDIIEYLTDLLDTDITLPAFYDEVMLRTGYAQMLEDKPTEENKTRLEKTVKRGAFAIAEEENDEYVEEGEFEIRVKTFPFKPMSPEEAILQMNLLGHAFYAFTDDKTNEVCVVYKRKNGKYGLIVQDK